ncbi:disease resistance protein RPM1-like [Abrus precatorius]|uniref:Disease resistance protein RPM1-like n=1 Tax=Abrus precatorius TaxID=3816 RepID=A0A8B8K2E6_ABRPR|nr:disease resistance protein RPM1-like [Abrus precatorius]XP_027337821.1 disease resistance protein RPM1-like [Abrus precatorius]
MAEIAVNLVIDKLIPLLRDEVNLLRGVPSKLESVKGQLQMIRAYVKDADAKAEMGKTNHSVKEWIMQMRQVSYRIEDVIDEYLLQVHNKLQDNCGVASVMCKICDMLRSVMSSHKIASEIDEIRESIERLSREKETYGFNPSALESRSDIATLHYLRQGALFIEDDQLVGIDHIKQVLSSWLSEKGSRTVISVVGEGGHGKTTVVNKVFNQKKREASFNCYAWITVSRLLKGENILKDLLKRFYEEVGDKESVKEISEMERNALVIKLREYLKAKSYLIVFDDVWEESFWGDVEHALPRDRGMIIITTRDRRVAVFCGGHGPIHVYDMQPLKHEDAWNLFCLKAFREDCPKDLKGLSEEFVKKCNGVPLAIVAIASLLSTKNKNVSEWKMVYDSLRSKLSSDPHLSCVHQVLSESYQDLSYHLKSCLLYFGLFPEDYSINCVKLINLWIAEGFVENKENDGQTLEEVAEEYLNELIARSLVKVAKASPYGRVRRCRVHDLMHDFILRKCEELNFCQVKKSKRLELHEWTRRLSIDECVEDDPVKKSVANYGLIRSCFLFGIDRRTPTSVFESLFSRFKLLARLDCERAPLDYLPRAVGDFLHLKYLSLRSTRIRTIPKFIGKLQNLETLDIKHTEVRELPYEINRLVKLRHLLVNRFGVGVKFKSGIGHLSSLQRLTMVDASDNGDMIMKELKNLKQIRDLGIYIHRKDGTLLCNAIECMTFLKSLTITAARDVIELESLSVCPESLQRLYLDGRLEKLPHWVPKLSSLVKLRLDGSQLTEDPLRLIKDLTALVELQLIESYKSSSSELCFEEGWFMNLKVLIILYPLDRVILKIEKGAMPYLQSLRLRVRLIDLHVPTHVQQVMQIN